MVLSRFSILDLGNQKLKKYKSQCWIDLDLNPSYGYVTLAHMKGWKIANQ